MYAVNQIRKKKLQIILVTIILLIICLLDIIVNMDIYKMVLSNNFININSLNDLNVSQKFAYVDLKKAKEENYSITNNKENVIIYTYNIENQNILVLLRENTIITDKTPVEIIKDTDYTVDIKDKLKQKNYYDIVLSNINYNIDRKIRLYKIYIIMIILLCSILQVIISLFDLIIYNRKNKRQKYK